MEIQYSPIQAEVQNILGLGQTKTNVHYSLTFILNDDGDLYDPLEITILNFTRDYVNNFCDLVTATVKVPLGKFAYKLWPNRKHLKATLTKYQLLEGTDVIDFETDPDVVKYTVYLHEDTKNPSIGQGKEAISEEFLDNTDIIDLKIELLDQFVEQAKNHQIGGVFPRITNFKEFFESYLTFEAKSIEIDKDSMLKGVDVEPDYRTSKLEHAVIPHGKVNLMDLPGYMQRRYGVYNAGLGSYIQSSLWYLFTYFNPDRFEKAPKTITAFVVPSNKYSGIERTYHLEDDALRVICTGQTAYIDDAEKNNEVFGNGVMYVAKNPMDIKRVTSKNKVTLKKEDNVRDYVDQPKGNKMNNVPLAKDQSTSNSWRENTTINKNKHGFYSFTWENSDPDVITPDMPIKILFQDGEDLITLKGRILNIDHVIIKAGLFKTKKHYCTSKVTCAVIKEETITA